MFFLCGKKMELKELEKKIMKVVTAIEVSASLFLCHSENKDFRILFSSSVPSAPSQQLLLVFDHVLLSFHSKRYKMLLDAVSFILPDCIFLLLLGPDMWHFSTHTSLETPESSNGVLAASARPQLQDVQVTCLVRLINGAFFNTLHTLQTFLTRSLSAVLILLKNDVWREDRFGIELQFPVPADELCSKEVLLQRGKGAASLDVQ